VKRTDAFGSILRTTLRHMRVIFLLALFFFSPSFPAQNDSVDSVDTLDTEVKVDKVADSIPPPVVRHKDNYLNEHVGENKFDREKWKKAIRNIDYTEKATPPKQEERESSKSFSSSPPLFTGPAFKYIFVGAVLLALMFLLFKLFTGRVGNKRVPSEKIISSLEDIEEISLVSESELERLLREALDRGDYKTAIRIYYVSSLRELAEKGIIQWKKEKTNCDYVLELGAASQYKVFKDLTLLFERIWYGDVILVKADYLQVEPLFKSFTDAVKSIPKLEK
jgi:hypothetical protein